MTVGANTEIDFFTRIANLEAALGGSGTLASPGGAQPQDAVQVAAGSADAITLRAGLVFVTSTGVDAMTLPAPIAGGPGVGQDGMTLTVYSTAAHAHTITTGTGGFVSAGTAGHVLTFTAAAGNGCTLKAYNGVWYITGNTNGTLS